MTTLRLETDNFLSNPLDLVEQVIINRDWAYDRSSDEEVVAEVTGHWCNYRVWFAWQQEQGALVFSCALESKVPQSAQNRIYPLLVMVNDKLWLGHFDLVSDDNTVAFRHTMLMRGGCVVAIEQLEDLVDIAISECDRFFPAFQALVWAGKNAKEALEAAIFETVGEA